MRRFQFSLLGLFGLVTCVAMGSAAMVHASAMWCSAVAVAVLLALLISILGVVFRRGPARAFWIGFLVFGWGSLALLFGTLVAITSPIAANNSYPGNNSVVIDGPLNALYEATHDTPAGYLPPLYYAAPPVYGLPQPPSPPPIPAAVPTLTPPTYAPQPAVLPLAPMVPILDPTASAYFKITGNLLFVILLALIGGILARGFSTAGETTSPG